MEEFEITLDECCKNLPSRNWRSIVVRKLVGELIQTENEENILVSCCKEGETSDDTKSKLFHYIVTNKRFFEICVGSDSFGYKSYFLKHLNGFTEKVVPYCNGPDYFKESTYFLDGTNDVSSYTVEFSFSVAKSESDKAVFSLSASPYPSDKVRVRFKELREFAREFHKVVTNL